MYNMYWCIYVCIYIHIYIHTSHHITSHHITSHHITLYTYIHTYIHTLYIHIMIHYVFMHAYVCVSGWTNMTLEPSSSSLSLHPSCVSLKLLHNFLFGRISMFMGCIPPISELYIFFHTSFKLIRFYSSSFLVTPFSPCCVGCSVVSCFFSVFFFFLG